MSRVAVNAKPGCPRGQSYIVQEAVVGKAGHHAGIVHSCLKLSILKLALNQKVGPKWLDRGGG